MVTAREPGTEGLEDEDDVVVKAAADLAPKLAARAEEAERLGRLPDETIEDLDRAGILTLTAPRTRGGQQAPSLTLLRVAEELARGCASTAFVAGAYLSTAWMTCLLSDEAQEEVFSSDNPRGIGAVNPGGGASLTSGGYVLSGRWPFCSGQHHAGWTMNFALAETEEGIPDVGIFLVPRAEFESAHDWQVTGMMATGSDTLSLQDAFVPAHRAVLLRDLMSNNLTSTLVRTEPYYQAPLLPFLSSTFAGTPLGMAEAALELFSERIQRRGITYTQYLRQAEAPVTHFQMAEARMKLDEARFHARRLARVAEMPAGEVDDLLRVRCRADAAWDLRLCREVIDIVESGSGAQSIHRRDPLQRIVRDMRAMSLHALLLHTTNAESYGRVLCGLDPGIPYV
jgi:alkylation response protein AidB-like acyl-CoA dehydrogenase